MTLFESIYRLLRPFEHPLHQHVWRTLRKFRAEKLLDVGGRRSNYTIGLNSAVWVSDIPREGGLKEQLDLGATDALREAVLKRRSNIAQYVYDDMTKTSLPLEYFDVVNAVEVLEHVEQDERFIENVARVLRPHGYFVMTTPNGDFRPTPYPDHKRHYQAKQLEALLSRHFREVRVEYRAGAVLVNLAWRLGAFGSPIYALSALMERIGASRSGPYGKLHLFAVCRK